jgi:hypothetical protein
MGQGYLFGMCEVFYRILVSHTTSLQNLTSSHTLLFLSEFFTYFDLTLNEETLRKVCNC